MWLLTATGVIVILRDMIKNESLIPTILLINIIKYYTFYLSLFIFTMLFFDLLLEIFVMESQLVGMGSWRCFCICYLFGGGFMGGFLVGLWVFAICICCTFYYNILLVIIYRTYMYFKCKFIINICVNFNIDKW